MIFNLSKQNSIANQFILELRDKHIQQDRMRFRRNLERLGEIMAYEVSKVLPYTAQTIQTPLASTKIDILQHQPLLLTIMRAGLPFFQGFLNTFDRADAAFIGAYRQEQQQDLTIKLDYVATPPLQDKIVILIDPMLATGQSVVDSLRVLAKHGNAAHIHIVSVIAAPEGIDFIQKNLTGNYSLWTCAVDEKLNDLFYIVPGLGDAGDLSYGTKL